MPRGCQLLKFHLIAPAREFQFLPLAIAGLASPTNSFLRPIVPRDRSFMGEFSRNARLKARELAVLAGERLELSFLSERPGLVWETQVLAAAT
jgi:hypothetical protein